MAWRYRFSGIPIIGGTRIGRACGA